MKTRIPIYLLAAFMLGFSAVSCNSDSDEDEPTPDLSDEYAVMVKSFSLQQNDAVLANLNNVFFTIDLDKAVVFNADSLPVGTKVDALVVSMSLSDPSSAYITMPGKTQTDTVVNFLTDATTPINFSRGYVDLEMTSYNGAKTRRYTIKVNVHHTDADSLCWGSTAMSALPTSLSHVTAQKTVLYQEKALCLTTDGSAWCRAVSADPADPASWTTEAVSLPSGAQVQTLAASSDALYVIASDKLYKSSDAGASWSDTGAGMCHIYGVVDGIVAGVRRSADNGYLHVTYPASTETPVPAGCPVKGTSEPVVYSTEWSEQNQMMVLGGETASGELTGDVWCFDGSVWADITAAPIPEVKGAAIVPYFAVRVGSNWIAKRRTIIFAIGGIDKDGAAVTKTYLSYDRGVHWAEAPEHMQLPEELAPRAYAQALVFDTRFDAASRATKPITEWECPYVYLFGGTDTQGQLYDQVWRGAINRFTFKPLQ